jgi:hypothetical protein
MVMIHLHILFYEVFGIMEIIRSYRLKMFRIMREAAMAVIEGLCKMHLRLIIL